MIRDITFKELGLQEGNMHYFFPWWAYLCEQEEFEGNKVHIDEKQEYVWQSDFKDCEEYKDEPQE